IRIIVGTENSQKEFAIHKGLICDRSEFFKNALGGNWAETDNVKLPEDDAELFAIYQEFLYTNRLPVNDNEGDPQNKYLILCKIYVLCEKLLDTSSKDAVLSALEALCKTKFDERRVCPDFQCVEAIYNGTPQGNKARMLLASVYAINGDEEVLEKILVSEHQWADFSRDLFRAMMAHR
ncbi:hypothetical protein M011DRAFT_391532, partial [Sporormia fimetaria CBS 119925]